MTDKNVKTSWPDKPAMTETWRGRPPIVAVLGHVDHGKTSLLDRIRETHLAEREAGGITQTIGAYQISFKNQKITFIDTPGHAAFSKMRARGGQAADLVILVVAADDGVMPQTVESIEYIKHAEIPFLVAINKIDLPGMEIEKVKNQLAQNGVLLEGYGGDVVAVPVSAKTGQGIDELLEMILLVAQMQEIKADPEGFLQGIVIESRKDQSGPIGTIIIKNGSLKIGDQILAGGVTARVKGLIGGNKKRIEKAEPGDPVEVLGFTSPPPVGAEVLIVGSASEEVLAERAKIPKFTPEEEKKLKIILKADSTGTLEAVSGSLGSEVLLVSAGVGDVSDSDVLLANVMGARIFGFRVKISGSVTKLAESENIQIKTYDIIYKFLEDMDKILVDRGRQAELKVSGRAEIVAEFIIEGKRIAGCRVIEGKLIQGDTVSLSRGGKLFSESQISRIKQRAKTIAEVKAKEECGVLLEPSLDFKPGDVLVSHSKSAKLQK
ncbi:MAG: translation initiation factor IF-2 [bacterium]|nr:translation initiation factor IF-2 [bacterium]